MNSLQPIDHNQPIAVPSVENTEFNHSDDSVGKHYIRYGYIIIAIFMTLVITWSYFAPMSSAAIATGVVSKDGYRKTVQHLEGGIIQNILVSEGEKVVQNQELIELKSTQSQADHDLLFKQKIIAEVKQAFLIAEQDGINDGVLSFPHQLQFEMLDQSVQQAIDGYTEAFHTRRNIYTEQLDIINQRINQAAKKIAALEQEQNALDEKGEIIAEEQAVYLEFEKKGLVTRAQSFALKRDKASNLADKTSNQVDIESTRQEIINLQMEKAQFIATTKERIFTELGEVRNSLVDLDEQMAKAEDRLQRTVIRAPISGTVVDLKVNTVNGVIKSGEPLLDIVPDQGSLVIDARVDPKDRDIVKLGQDAEIRFTAFNQRITEPLAGKVTLISADSLNEVAGDGTLASYYKAKVELLDDPKTVLGGTDLYPGMQADVMIITGRRTALQYFLKPIIKSFNRAFRDD